MMLSRAIKVQLCWPYIVFIRCIYLSSLYIFIFVVYIYLRCIYLSSLYNLIVVYIYLRCIYLSSLYIFIFVVYINFICISRLIIQYTDNVWTVGYIIIVNIISDLDAFRHLWVDYKSPFQYNKCPEINTFRIRKGCHIFV